MNPYKVLGVSENASQEEIRKAYLALVKKYHPDRYADGPMKDMANEKLKEINQAYEMLTKKKESSGYGGSSNYGGYSSHGHSTYSQGLNIKQPKGYPSIPMMAPEAPTVTPSL